MITIDSLLDLVKSEAYQKQIISSVVVSENNKLSCQYCSQWLHKRFGEDDVAGMKARIDTILEKLWCHFQKAVFVLDFTHFYSCFLFFSLRFLS